MSWWSRLTNVVRSARLERDLADEQRFHIEARADDLEQRGLSREQALEQASRQFGPRLQLQESSRDVKLATFIESLWRDLRLGLRLLRRDAVVSSAAVLSLGLAIGASAAAFSLIDALLLRELPVRDPQGLVHVIRLTNKSGDLGVATTFSYPFFERVRRAAAPQVDVFGMSPQSLRQALLPDAAGVEEKLRTQFVSGNAFGALGITAALGRVLTTADDVTPGGHPVAVISHTFWKRRLGGDPRAIGEWIRIEQRPYEIVGVAQPGFTGTQPGALTDVWLPAMMFDPASFNAAQWGWLQIWGRMAPSVTRERVRPIVQTTLTNFEAEQPTSARGRDEQAAEAAIDVRTGATGFSEVRQKFDRPLLVLAAIVGVVLLIACSNVANLLLARGAARRREMALRSSIGAGRARLIQQVLVESSVLTLAATAIGVILAMVAVPIIIGLITTNENPVYLDAGLSWRAALFVAALGGVTTALFGSVPAMRAAAATPAEITALGDRSHSPHTGVARPLIAAQVAFSLMILFVATLLLRSFDRLLAVDLGFQPDRLAVLSIETRDRFEPVEARELQRQLLASVHQFPGIDNAGMSTWALFRGWSSGGNADLPGKGRVQFSRLSVSPRFFETMGTRLIDGREFDPRDSDAINPVPVIVNESFARKHLGGERAVGATLQTTSHGQPVAYEIVGLVADVRDGAVRGEMKPFLFSPLTDAGGALVVRSALDVRTVADRVRAELARIHPTLRLVDVTTQNALVGGTLLRERLLAVLSGFFAALGLALAAVGLYGVSSHAVVRRSREIGIRVTLGARPAAILRSVLGRVAVGVAAGSVAGLAGGLYFARFVETLLYEVEPLSASSLALPALCLTIVAFVAAWPPARRALRVDPTEALRTE